MQKHRILLKSYLKSNRFDFFFPEECTYLLNIIKNCIDYAEPAIYKLNSMSTNQVNNKTLLPGHEYPEKDEDKFAGKIVKLLQNQMLRIYAKNEAKQLRQIHPKMNGCVKAEFIIENDLPEELKVGIFKEARSFPAWIRFSNGDTKPLPDWKKDIRGFAIKIMNVPGKKIVESKKMAAIMILY